MSVADLHRAAVVKIMCAPDATSRAKRAVSSSCLWKKYGDNWRLANCLCRKRRFAWRGHTQINQQ